jgi:hypothetical protein
MTPATLGEPTLDISMGTPTDYADDATASTTARCFLEPDPLAEAMCEGAGPPAWIVSVDMMLDELVALSGPILVAQLHPPTSQAMARMVVRP